MPRLGAVSTVRLSESWRPTMAALCAPSSASTRVSSAAASARNFPLNSAIRPRCSTIARCTRITSSSETSPRAARGSVMRNSSCASLSDWLCAASEVSRLRRRAAKVCRSEWARLGLRRAMSSGAAKSWFCASARRRVAARVSASILDWLSLTVEPRRTSSMRSRGWPASTVSPSRTRISATMPLSRLCTTWSRLVGMILPFPLVTSSSSASAAQSRNAPRTRAQQCSAQRVQARESSTCAA